MSLRRPAIRRIAIIFVGIAAAATHARAQDTLFGPGAGRFGVPDRSASQAAREELTQARLALLRAKILAAQAVRLNEAAVRDDEAYRELQSAAARATGEYYAARRTPLDALASDAEYDALRRRRESIRGEIRRVAGPRGAPVAKLLPLARRALDAGQRITRSETIALALDPRVEEAREAMTSAYALLRRAGEYYRERISGSPEVVLAREELAFAKERVAEANRRLAAALKAEAAAERSGNTAYR